LPPPAIGLLCATTRSAGSNSYSKLVARYQQDLLVHGQTLGAVPMVVFFQMDKMTHGLKRIQLERPAPRGQPARLPRDSGGAA
jgi:hypothetical protein